LKGTDDGCDAVTFATPDRRRGTRARRKANIDFARGNVRFEGFVLSPEVEEINRRFIDGELSGEEHVAAVLQAVRRA
jgi:hypothetical protein